jgi:sec-independent protein translocase protein TatA
MARTKQVRANSISSNEHNERKKSQEQFMFEGLFQPTHLMIIAGIALLIFGPKKLPELGKGLGESIRGFKSAMAAKDEPAPAKATHAPEHTEQR